MRRLVLGLGLGLAGVVTACTPSQDISFTVDRPASILGVRDGLTEVRLTGYVWCSDPSVGIDLGVALTQDGTTRTSSQTISCRATAPERFATTVRFPQGFPHVGSATVAVHGSTDEDGANDAEDFQGRLDLS